MTNEEIHSDLIRLTAKLAEASLNNLDDEALRSLKSQHLAVGSLLEAATAG